MGEYARLNKRLSDLIKERRQVRVDIERLREQEDILNNDIANIEGQLLEMAYLDHCDTYGDPLDD